MKPFFLLAALLVSGAAAAQQPAAPAPVAAAPSVIKWQQTSQQFGSIKQGVPVTATFRFTNTGRVPVLLTNVQGSCGCTVPAWSHEPVAPGKSSVVSATFNAAHPGAFTKTVTVTTSADTAGPQVLTLQGTVLESPAAVAQQ